MPNKFRGNSFTPRQRRVLNYLLTTFDWQSQQPDLNSASKENLTEITESLREVIDSANPDADNAATN